MIAVLDTGAIDALTPLNEKGRARLRALRQRVQDLSLPSSVLAEGLLSGHPGRDYHVRRLLEVVDIADVDEELGYAAGLLRRRAMRAGADPAPSGVDATVVAFADRRAANDEVLIVTSDPEDIEALAIFTNHPQRLSIRTTS